MNKFKNDDPGMSFRVTVRGHPFSNVKTIFDLPPPCTHYCTFRVPLPPLRM